MGLVCHDLFWQYYVFGIACLCIRNMRLCLHLVNQGRLWQMCVLIQGYSPVGNCDRLSRVAIFVMPQVKRMRNTGIRLTGAGSLGSASS